MSKCPALRCGDICRTCLAPIWNEGGTVGHRKRAEGWSDRIERGGDSLVCFKAVGYRHVPLSGREAALYDCAYSRGRADLKAKVEALADEWASRVGEAWWRDDHSRADDLRALVADEETPS